MPRELELSCPSHKELDSAAACGLFHPIELQEIMPRELELSYPSHKELDSAANTSPMKFELRCRLSSNLAVKLEQWSTRP
ncbi:Os05g0402400 [Oryza sativa Japonica Group]|jgi:hypothetical protein|uniref:Os05g0402400 protein n=1 Tax=Oryza sativa subsp. japonica TaxID=39947 RepID=A0A0P0WM42_ORYSJ|nr:Os05g0402400 [Oryza sativa Japonica Group]